MPVVMHPEIGEGTAVIELSGKLSLEDYQHFVPRLEELIAERGKIKVLVLMRDFHGWDTAALWEDVKFDMNHFGHIERIAMVGDKAWEHGMAIFCRPFTKAKIRYFDHSVEGEARTWISE